jgi:hypothetical protein
VSACRSCGAVISWGVTADGKRVPLDLPRQAMVAVDHLTDGTPVVEVRSVFVPHFATCPDADKWRKQK